MVNKNTKSDDKMKKVYDIVKRGSFYTILFTLFIYTIGALTQTPNASLPWHKFLLVLAFGLIISIGQFVDEILKFNSLIKILINYALVLSGFLLLYLNLTESITSAKVFAGVGVFTVFYAVVRVIKYLFDRFVLKKPITQPESVKKSKPKPEYRPLYSDDD